MGDIWWDISYTGDISGQKSQTFEIFRMWEPKKLEISPTVEIFHEISHCMWESPKGDISLVGNISKVGNISSIDINTYMVQHLTKN